MIFETARITIDPDQAEAFEEAVSSCQPLFRSAKGCHGMALEREIENPSHYLLRVVWESVEDHMDGFRSSDAFQSWRKAVGPFFAQPPHVIHSRTISTFF
jgi:quinol monooxygenase YgiN